jgi:hypothetical protein
LGSIIIIDGIISWSARRVKKRNLNNRRYKMLKNLTPHKLNIVTEYDNVIELEPSGVVARVSTTRTKIDQVGEIGLFLTTYGKTMDLPEPEEDTIYIVSLLVKSANPKRLDLASPGELVRNEKGEVIGCKGLSL